MEVLGGGRKGGRLAAIAQETFLATCSSAKEQQKGSDAALIHMRFQEASGTWDAVGLRCTPHSERPRVLGTGSNRRS